VRQQRGTETGCGDFSTRNIQKIPETLMQCRRVGDRGHAPPGASRGGTKGGAVIFATRNMQKFCELS